MGGVDPEYLHPPSWWSSDGHEEEAERVAARVDGGAHVGDAREADDGVLVIVEAVGRDGAVRVERQEGRVVHE